MTQQKASFRILVATDNHIGFKESHHIRGDDSFNAFEEILSTAKENKVDFVLLGGDLFHEATPSQGCLYRSMNIFKKYIFGAGELNFTTKGLSKPHEPNYLNENLNIDLPVFIIHGNHDYPGNVGDHVSSLDLLHASHLVILNSPS
jgi:double-strand break repair protein MRE11